MLVRDVAERAQGGDEYSLGFVYVKPSFASGAVGDDDKVNRPFGRGESVGVGGRFWGSISGSEVHLGGSKGGENFYVLMGEDVS